MASYEELASTGLEAEVRIEKSEWLRFVEQTSETDTIVKVIGISIASEAIEIELRADLSDAIQLLHLRSKDFPKQNLFHLIDENCHFRFLVNLQHSIKDIKLYDIDYTKNLTTICLALQ